MASYHLSRFTGSKTDQQKIKILEAIEVLDQLGIPLEKYTQKQWRRVERLALVLLALGDIYPNTSWSEAKSKNNCVSKTTREIINFINEYYSESMSSGSYDDFKRKEIDFLMLDSIVVPGFIERTAVNDSRSGLVVQKSSRSRRKQDQSRQGDDKKGEKMSCFKSQNTKARPCLFPYFIVSYTSN